MIRRAYLMRGDGHVLFVRHYIDEIDVSTSAPAHIRACVTLFHAQKSTVMGRPYILKQDEIVWVYCFFNNFVLVIEATADEPIEWLNRRIVSLGRFLARDFSSFLSTWSGGLVDVADLLETFDTYMSLPVPVLSTQQQAELENIITRILAKHSIAYAGVFDAFGEMICGNIPDEHLPEIQRKIVSESVKPTVELVPSVFQIDNYDVHILRIYSLTAVVAPYPGERKLEAVRAINDFVVALTPLIGA